MISKKSRTRSLVIMVILGLAVTSWGAWLYYTATVSSTREEIPPGGIDIWAGPYQRANVTATWFYASVVDNSITIEVEFAYPQYSTMHFYAILPFKVLTEYAYLSWNSMQFNATEARVRNLGEIGANFHISPVNSATIINESFTPNPFSPPSHLSVRLGVKLYVEQLIASSEGATDTVVLTFAGATLEEDDMIPYMQTDTQPVWKQPLLIFVDFPRDAFFSTSSFPSPAEYFVTAQYRSVFYNLNFTYQTQRVSLAQSILCSFNYPAKEQEIQQHIFLGGLLIGLGAPLLVGVFSEIIRSDQSLEDELRRPAQQEYDKIEWHVVLAMLSSVAGVLIGIGFQGYLDYMRIPSWARVVELPIGIGMFAGVLWIIRKSRAKRN